MREKMRKHLGRGAKDGKFSLKQGSGGIVDIEFMVQFAVSGLVPRPSLAYSLERQHPHNRVIVSMWLVGRAKRPPAD